MPHSDNVTNTKPGMPSITSKHHQLRRWVGGACIVLLCVVVLFIVSTVPAIQALLVKPLIISQEPVYADAIIVLGGGLKKDGTVGSIVQQRVEKGVELSKIPRGTVVLFSGGPIKNKKYIESVQMQLYAKQVGLTIPSLTEERSTSTRENALESRLLMSSHHLKTANIITSEFHSKRACAVFRKLSMVVTCIAAPEKVTTLLEQLKLTKSIWREYGATVYYKLLGYI